jgi:CYTH domain-containing protein
MKKDVSIAVLAIAVVVLLTLPMFGADEDALTRVYDRTQVERRFLVDFDDIPRGVMGQSTDIVQSYISFTPEIRLRNVNGNEFLFTLRTPINDGGEAHRRDVEFNLTADEYNELFQKISGTAIRKARYRVTYDDVNVRLDIFFGDLDGLVFAEILFSDAEEAAAFMPLHWFGEEITEDGRYRNAALSRDGMPN